MVSGGRQLATAYQCTLTMGTASPRKQRRRSNGAIEHIDRLMRAFQLVLVGRLSGGQLVRLRREPSCAPVLYV